ncbi:MAG: type II toxin-antitoxin system RelE/ParE family toxin [Treponema sp.]|nr:type II toxin-antitoxin system RelE/ParE family toxin [Treponema sp.]MCL2233766.1 type II toxin-antitoxin system RelE/ParE family toxin [Treponema sp.]
MNVLLHRDADKYLNRLNEADRERINDAIDDLEEEPPQGDITPIAGEPGRFRTRVGSYRLLWRIKDDHILVTHIDPRGQAYKKKNKGNKR